MENTGDILFESDALHWFLAIGDNFVGPMKASDIYAKLMAGEVGWSHYAWKKGDKDWTRLCDLEVFRSTVAPKPGRIPTEPRPVVKAAVKRPPMPPQPRSWFLYYNDSQFGPFSEEEVVNFLRVGKINGRVHAWRDEMEEWERLERISPFQEELSLMKQEEALDNDAKLRKSAEPWFPGPGEAEHLRMDQRSAPRRPLLAKIVMSNDQSVTVAMCRDISVGGMQVLTDRIPGPVGSRIKLNVSASGELKDSGRAPIEPFVAEGKIVRILEDGRGFSFRFERLPDNAKRSIEDYITSSGA